MPSTSTVSIWSALLYGGWIALNFAVASAAAGRGVDPRRARSRQTARLVLDTRARGPACVRNASPDSSAGPSTIAHEHRSPRRQARALLWLPRPDAMIGAVCPSPYQQPAWSCRGHGPHAAAARRTQRDSHVPILIARARAAMPNISAELISDAGTAFRSTKRTRSPVASGRSWTPTPVRKAKTRKRLHVPATSASSLGDKRVATEHFVAVVTCSSVEAVAGEDVSFGGVVSGRASTAVTRDAGVHG